MTTTHNDNTEEERYRAEVRRRYTNNSTKKSKNNLQRDFGIVIVFIIVISIIIYSNFNYGGSKNSSTLSNIPTINENPEEVAEYKVSLDKHTKGFNDHSYTPQITFSITFANNTYKDMRGFEGIVTYSDIFDNEIESLKFSYDQGLPARHEVTIEKAVDYNQFIDSRVRLNEIENKNLKYKWKVSTILYEDGTRETY